jgi:hypothetical protein
MARKPGAGAIAYHQGANGEVYIAEVPVFLEMFNRERFDRKKPEQECSGTFISETWRHVHHR